MTLSSSSGECHNAGILFRHGSVHSWHRYGQLYKWGSRRWQSDPEGNFPPNQVQSDKDGHQRRPHRAQPDFRKTRFPRPLLELPPCFSFPFSLLFISPLQNEVQGGWFVPRTYEGSSVFQDVISRLFFCSAVFLIRLTWISFAISSEVSTSSSTRWPSYRRWCPNWTE